MRSIPFLTFEILGQKKYFHLVEFSITKSNSKIFKRLEQVNYNWLVRFAPIIGSDLLRHLIILHIFFFQGVKPTPSATYLIIRSLCGRYKHSQK